MFFIFKKTYYLINLSRLSPDVGLEVPVSAAADAPDPLYAGGGRGDVEFLENLNLNFSLFGPFFLGNLWFSHLEVEDDPLQVLLVLHPVDEVPEK